MRKNAKPKNKIEDDKFFEKLTCVIVGILLILLFLLSFNRREFIPATLIMFSLLMFCIVYYFREDKKKTMLLGVLLGLGIGILLFAVFFSLMEMS